MKEVLARTLTIAHLEPFQTASARFEIGSEVMFGKHLFFRLLTTLTPSISNMMTGIQMARKIAEAATAELTGWSGPDHDKGNSRIALATRKGEPIR